MSRRVSSCVVLVGLALALLAEGAKGQEETAAAPATPAQAVDAECGEFKCMDGECIWAGSRCDGAKHCKDGSDETPEACDAPSQVVRVNSVYSVRVNYTEAQRAVVVLLCDNQDCSALWLWGATPAGELRCEAWGHCRPGGFPCSSKQGEEEPSEWGGFPSGEIALEVERRYPNLTVWLKNHSDHKAMVVAQDGMFRLTIRPYNWVEDMPVRFLSSRSSIGK